MTDDIVKRRRELAMTYWLHRRYYAEAAYEIEKLREASALSGGPSQESFDAVVAERDRLIDEIARLRKLLAATERDLGRALFALEHHMKERRD